MAWGIASRQPSRPESSRADSLRLTARQRGVYAAEHLERAISSRISENRRTTLPVDASGRLGTMPRSEGFPGLTAIYEVG